MSSLTCHIGQTRCARRLPILLAIVVGVLLPGCAKPYQVVHDGSFHDAECRYGVWREKGHVARIDERVIAIDKEGSPRDPATLNTAPRGYDAFQDQIDRMFAAMDRFHARHPGEPRRILIFVHGGMNAPSHSLIAADAELEQIEDAGYFPIFVNWNSDLVDSYGEHVLAVTQGQQDKSLVRKLLSPLYLFADAGRAITHVPVVWSNQIGTDSSAAAADTRALAAKMREEPGAPSGAADVTRRWANASRSKSARSIYDELRARSREDLQNDPHQRMRISLGQDRDVDAGYLAELGAMYVLTSPTKFGLGWLIDDLGTAALHNMSRRTLMMYDGLQGGKPTDPDLLEPGTLPREQNASAMPSTTRTTPTDFKQIGALSVFRQRLAQKVGADGGAADKNDYDLTLIGHSMGTMILNEWLRRDILEDKHMFYSHIVYMAAACSVRDFERSVVFYLKLHRPDPNALHGSPRWEGAQFHNLMLHPIADLRDREFDDIPPRGSLLVWIDDFLSDPQTPLDRTLGRWDNILSNVGVIPPEIRGQVTLKAFSLDRHDNPHDDNNPGPQIHGAFRDKKYWNPTFWQAVVPKAAASAAQEP